LNTPAKKRKFHQAFDEEGNKFIALYKYNGRLGHFNTHLILLQVELTGLRD